MDEQPEYVIRSEWWPEFVVLNQSIESPDVKRPMTEGTRGVLIRVEESGLLRVDFGSVGLTNLSVEQTNFLEQYEELKHTRSFENNAGRWNLHLGQGSYRVLDARFARGSDSYVAMASYFIIFCAPTKPDKLTFVAEVFGSEPMQRLHDEGARFMFIPLDEVRDQAFTKAMVGSAPHYHFLMPPFSAPYARILISKPEAGTIFLIDKNGKMLIEPRRISSQAEWLEFASLCHSSIESEKELRSANDSIN